QVAEPPVPHLPCRPVVDEQPRLVATLERLLRDQLRGQVVVERRRLHPANTLSSPPWTRVLSTARASGSWRRVAASRSRRTSKQPSTAHGARSRRSRPPPPSSR